MPHARRLAAAAAALALALAGGCGGDRASSPAGPAAPAGDSTERAAPGARARDARPARPALCRRLAVRVTGRVTDPAATELSGLVRSRRTAGVLWAHNDSGDGPRLFALRTDGSVIAQVAVPGAQAVDWEDIAAGPAADGSPLLYVGDIGDNRAQRSSIDVYRLPEPAPGTGSAGPATRLRFTYPDGPHDAEALLVDPLGDELVIVTKTIGGARAYLGRARGSGGVLRRGPAVPVDLATAGDVSRDGHTVAIRGYLSVSLWRRRGREPLARALARSPCVSPTSLASEGQGEALALEAHGRSFLTVPEGNPAPLRRYAPAAP